jgi:ribosomal 50S subunit-associated protein YjgA (DUF615 family)
MTFRSRKQSSTPSPTCQLAGNWRTQEWRDDLELAAPMVNEQAIIRFLRQLDRALSAALHADEQQRLHRLTLTQTLVLAVLAAPRHRDQALRKAAGGIARVNS